MELKTLTLDDDIEREIAALAKEIFLKAYQPGHGIASTAMARTAAREAWVAAQEWYQARCLFDIHAGLVRGSGDAEATQEQLEAAKEQLLPILTEF